MKPTARRAATLAFAAVLLALPASVAQAAPGDLDLSFDAGTKTFAGNDFPISTLVQPDGKIVVAGSRYGTASDFAVSRLTASGALDTGFGQGGTATVDFGGYDYGYAAALQPDGKIVVAGNTSIDSDVAVARLNPDGSLDDTFDGDGKKRFGYAGYDGARAVLVQPDGRIVVAGYGGPDTVLAVTRLNPDGSFDTSFDGDGTSGADFAGNETGWGVARQADGKIVVAGRTSENNDFAVARFNVNGSLDPAFSFDGKNTVNFGGYDDGRALAVQSNGKIVLAGSSSVSDTDMAVARLNADGSLDPTFDGDGRRKFGDDVYDFVNAVVPQPDGKVVLAGYGGDGSDADFLFARVSVNGSLDTTFDGDGIARVDFTGYDDAYGAARQADGKIVAAGWTSLTEHAAVARVNANGSLDAAFAGDGSKLYGDGNYDAAQATLVQPDGKIVVAGYHNTTTSMEVARLNPIGSFDLGFHFTGRVDIDFGATSHAYAVARQSDGKLVVAGTVGNDVAVARLEADGSPDLTFHGDGNRDIDYGGYDYASAVLVQPDGKIVIAGRGGPSLDIAITRLNPDGSLDTGFDGDGTRMIDLGGTEFGNAVARQADGKLVVAGLTTVGFDVAVERLNPDGSLDTTFDGDGVKTVDYGGSDDARAVLVQADGKIVVAGYGGPNTAFEVARLNRNGSPDASFDGDGTSEADFGAYEQGLGAALQRNGKIVVAGWTTSNNSDMAVARFNVNGSLDATFSSDGRATVDTGGYDAATAMALQPNGRIVLAGYNGERNGVAVARLIGDP